MSFPISGPHGFLVHRHVLEAYRAAGDFLDRRIGALATAPNRGEKSKQLPAASARFVNVNEIEQYVRAEMQSRQIPGLALGIVRDGVPVLLRAHGLASLEHQEPVRVETVFDLASVTKPFTAMAAMMLVEEGKLGLDDRLSHYLGDLPEEWKEITIRQLLSHTAGTTVLVAPRLRLDQLPHLLDPSCGAEVDLAFELKAQRLPPRKTMVEVIRSVARAFGVNPNAIRKGRGGAARMLAAWIGWQGAILELRPIAAALLLRSSGHVSNLVRRCERELARDKLLQQLACAAIDDLRVTG